MNDRRLLHRLRQGDESVLPELIRQYSGYVYAIASNILSHAMSEEGMEKRDALEEAGKTRMRPILMTTITTVLGLLVMAMAQGQGSEMMQPVAIVCIGGLTYATLMTLFVIPEIEDHIIMTAG